MGREGGRGGVNGSLALMRCTWRGGRLYKNERRGRSTAWRCCLGSSRKALSRVQWKSVAARRQVVQVLGVALHGVGRLWVSPAVG